MVNLRENPAKFSDNAIMSEKNHNECQDNLEYSTYNEKKLTLKISKYFFKYSKKTKK